MSNQENSTQTSDLSSEQAITIQPSGIAAYTGTTDWTASEGEQARSANVGLDAVLHSVRRHWLVMFATGIALGVGVGIAAFLAIKPKFEATATLVVAPKNPVLLSGGTNDETQGVADEFNIYRGNQAYLIKERYVLDEALRNPKIKNLPSIAREDASHNARQWLSSILQVDVRKSTGVITVAAALPDPNEAAAIVNAVVSAYMDKVVYAEHTQRQDRLASLTNVSIEKSEDVRHRREQLTNTSVGDEQAASLRAQMAVTIYAEYQRELQKMRFDRTVLQGRLDEDDILKATIDDPIKFEVPETEIAAVLSNNPVYREALPRQEMLQSLVTAQRQLLAKGAKPSPILTRAITELDNTNAIIDNLKAKADKQVRQAERIRLERERNRLSEELRIATEQVGRFEKEVEGKQREADQIGKTTVAQQTQRAELETVERILRGVDEERERLKVELKSSLRVAVVGDKNAPAAVPEKESGTTFRYFLIGVSSLAGMCLPAIGILAWDLRKRRVNSPADVSKRLQIPVMGILPLIPPMVMRKLGSSSRRSQIWKMRYTEAVDGVVARLLRSAECDDTRVVMITSALSGEGKTWLATQLAMGLARAQRRTVLVDFDLRQPALDGALGLPLGPGVCEALRGQGDIVEMVQPTDSDYLSVVTAGNWNRQVLPALGNGSVSRLLETLREQFDFVIIDSSPLLPVVDARLVCQNVDCVLLSVLRDVSEAAKVQAAQEMLNSFGVSKVEAVVTSGEHHGNAKSLLYQAALAEEQPALLSDEHTS